MRLNKGAFYGCSGLKSVTIGDGVTFIASSAFEHCSELTSVTIPNSVTSINSHAFYGCAKLVSIQYNGTKAQWKAISKASDSLNMWNYNTGSYTIYCTDGNIVK